jgi:hypothetical protein
MPEIDSFFRYLLTLGLAENDQLYKLIVVDKAPDGLRTWTRTAEPTNETSTETVEHRYRRMLARLFVQKRLYFSNDGFHFFLQRAASTWLSRAETIMF